jgi:DNA-binding beta-propeller fold protein YncE
MAYLPKSNQLVVTDAGESAVRLVDCKRYTIVKTIRLKPEVDHSAISYDSKYFYVENAASANGSTHAVSIIDTESFTHVGDIEELPGSSNEGMVIDQAGTRLYVNLTAAAVVGVVDLRSKKLVAKWPLPNAHLAHAIALDETNHRLFTVTRNPALFIVYDTDTGKVVASLPCVGVNSDISIDTARRRIYITGSEAASVFRQIDANHYEHLSDVTTAYRAKTSVFVPQLSRLYVAVSGKGKPGAKLELRIYEAQ